MKRLILGAVVLTLHLIALGTVQVPAPGAGLSDTDRRPVFKLVDLREAPPANQEETREGEHDHAKAGAAIDEAMDAARPDGSPLDGGALGGATLNEGPQPEEGARSLSGAPAPESEEDSVAGSPDEPREIGASPQREQGSRDGPREPAFYPIHLVSVPPHIPAEELRRRIHYPYAARRRGVEGVVYLELYIGESGRVVRAEVLEGPGHGLNEAARSAFKELTVSPARRGDRAVAVRYRYPVRFELE